MLSSNGVPDTSVAFGSFVDNYISKLQSCFTDDLKDNIRQLSIHLKSAWVNGQNVFICGNGGSAGNAIHIANDFLYGAGACGSSPSLPGLRVEALTANPAVLTCLANDTGYENIFANQLKVKGQRNDLLIALSGSGKSQNIVNALKIAKDLSINSFAILAFDGGECKKLADTSIHFKTSDMQLAEDAQLIVGHLCMQWLSDNKPVKINS